MIFVSGGTGFVGSHAVKGLVEAGHSVRLLTQSGPGLATDLPQEMAEFVRGSITDPRSLKDKMEGCDIVTNFVGIIVETRQGTFENIHVDGVRNLLDEAKGAGVKRLIHISALGTSDRPASEYFKTKWMAEQLIKTSGIPYVILRPSLVFGPEDKFFNMLKPMLFSPVVPVIGSGKTLFQPIWVEDIAACIVKAAKGGKKVEGTWEIAGPEQLTFDELLDEMAEAMNMASRLKAHVPVGLMKPFATIAETILPKPPLTNDQLKMLSIDNVTDSNAIIDTFGVEPSAFRDIVCDYW